MKKNLRTKITSRSNSEAIAQKLFALLITSTLSSAVFTTHATAQTAKNATTGTGNNGPLLANAVAGKLMVKADVGYVLSFAGDWNKSTTASNGASVGGNTSAATGGVGYGASLGWTSKTGFGLSADYLGFNHKWIGLGTDGKGTEYNYDAPYHVMTITPSYRFKLDSADNWGLRVGLGVGFSLSDVSWAQKFSNGAQSKAGTKVAGGAIYGNNGAAKSPIVFNNTSACNLAAFTASVYADTLGGSGNSVTLKSLQCSGRIIGGNVDVTPVASGLQDSDIAKALNEGTLAYFAGSGNVSYAVWNALSATVQAAITAAGGKSAPAPANNSPASSGGSAKDDAGFVLAPQVALEYDNNLLHADINVKYIHELFNVRYFGSEGSVSGTASSGAITYTSKPGPLALFIGAGLGINF